MNNRFRNLAIGAALLGLGAFIGTIGPVQRAVSQGMVQITTLAGTEQISLNYPCTVSCFITTQTLQGYGRQSPGSGGVVNSIIGGDYGTNPFQRGTANATGVHISSTATYTADQTWMVGGASSSIDWSQQTSAADTPPRSGGSLRMQRTSGNTDTAAICWGHTFSSEESYRFQNHTAFYELWAQTGANYSGGAVTVSVYYGTGANQSTASLLAGSWTNQTTASAATIASGSTPPTITSPTTFTPTATQARFSMAFTVPLMVSTSDVSQVGMKACWTPSGTAGANDWIEFSLEQLEVNDTGSPGAFDHLPGSLTYVRAHKFLAVIPEPASGVGVGVGSTASTTTCSITIALPDIMIAAPTLSFAGTALSASTWTVTHVVTATALSTPYLAVNTANTPTAINLTATVASGLTAGQACVLTGAGGGSKIVASAEL
jgi:hypothetical protein